MTNTEITEMTIEVDNFNEVKEVVSNKGEKLIFKRIPNKKNQDGEHMSGAITFGLFKEVGEQVGESFCRTDRFNWDTWYLDNIEIFGSFKRKGFGSLLLEKTCEALSNRVDADIILSLPGESTSADGFNRKSWYEKHGFVSHPNPEKTFMWREKGTQAASV